MLQVRRSLTEILLEVTNDEIASVCKEVWKRHAGKGIKGVMFIEKIYMAELLHMY